MTHPGGRPLKFSSPEMLQEKIDAYFKYCDEYTEEKYVKDVGAVKIKSPRAYLVSGLAVWLDTSRETLLNYEDDRPEYSDTIKRAKAKCLQDSESRLFHDFTPGVIFSMKNNWHFVDKTEIDNNITLPSEIRIKSTKEIAEERKIAEGGKDAVQK